MLVFKESSIVYGGTSAYFEKSSAKIPVQFYERKTRNSIFWKFLGNHMMEISWKLYAGKCLGNYMLGNFLETMCWEISWKLYAGKFLETICWDIRVDTSSF